MSGILIIAVVVALIGITIFMLREVKNAIPPSGWLLLDELGRIERDLRHLEDVVIILDKIERPYHLLLDAVLDNLRTNVKYHFFVSMDHYASSLEHFAPFFEKLIEVAATLKDASIDKNDKLTHIYRFPLRRHSDYPYIFYCFKDGRPYNRIDHKGINIIGFRGCDKGRGIADQYQRLQAEAARSYLETTFAAVAHLGHTHLPSWLINFDDDEFAREQTVKLLEHRPPIVLNTAAVAEIEKINS